MENYDFTTDNFKNLLRTKLRENEVGVTFTKGEEIGGESF